MARRKPPTVHGFCIVDKPSGMTSHDVVGLLRRRFDERRIGHAGTLDPSATGVLLIGVGDGTRLLSALLGSDKSYIGEVVLGSSTNTLDADGEVTASYDMSAITIDDVRRVIGEHLTGQIMQTPPMVSARRVDGRRLHELAREGIEVEREARPVQIRSLTAEPTDDPGVFRIDVTCSTGTYVRTLADDLGRLLGGGAHLRNLRRTSVGTFDISEAQSPDTCELLPLIEALRGVAVVPVDQSTAELIGDGRILPAFAAPGPWAITSPDGGLIAVYEPFGSERAKPSVVLAHAFQR
jgi:tRNA pseudouridine55 synthase